VNNKDEDVELIHEVRRVRERLEPVMTPSQTPRLDSLSRISLIGDL
jgi:hypothetical protein